MNQDQLFLLKPDFSDQGQTYYCPYCAEVLGLREFYPALKASSEIPWVDFARPRPELVALLGEDHQSCPVLVLHAKPANLPASVPVQYANGHAFVEGAREIGQYLAHAQGIGLPH